MVDAAGNADPAAPPLHERVAAWSTPSFTQLVATRAGPGDVDASGTVWFVEVIDTTVIDAAAGQARVRVLVTLALVANPTGPSGWLVAGVELS